MEAPGTWHLDTLEIKADSVTCRKAGMEVLRTPRSFTGHRSCHREIDWCVIPKALAPCVLDPRCSRRLCGCSVTAVLRRPAPRLCPGSRACRLQAPPGCRVPLLTLSSALTTTWSSGEVMTDGGERERVGVLPGQ